MKETTQKTQIPLQLFQSGQIWQMEGSRLQIGTVGKLLVHYKHFKGDAKRSANSLSAKVALEKFLKVKKAVLLHDPTKVTPQIAKSAMTQARPRP